MIPRRGRHLLVRTAKVVNMPTGFMAMLTLWNRRGTFVPRLESWWPVFRRQRMASFNASNLWQCVSFSSMLLDFPQNLTGQFTRKQREIIKTLKELKRLVGC